MKILIAHRFFWPDTPACATILGMIGRHWASEGHEVTVFTAYPAYREDGERLAKVESFHGIEVFRSRLPFGRSRRNAAKAVSGLVYLAKLFFFIIRKRRFDVVLCSTMPPVLIGVVSRLGSWMIGARFLYQCMDIHPEVAVATGMMRWNAAMRLLQKLDHWACRHADRVQVLSRDMAAVYRNRGSGGDSIPIVTIPNFGIEEFGSEPLIEPTVEGHERNGPSYRILFAGNLGRFQALPELIEAMTLLRDEVHLCLSIVGTGVLEERLKKMVRERDLANVEFHPFQPVDVARRMIRQSDLCLVSLAPEVFRYAFPSKTTTIMAEGTPILAVVEQESELAWMVKTKGLGWSCEQSPPAIATSIREAYQERAQIPRMRDHIRKVYASEFSAVTVLGQWSELLSQLNPDPD